MKLTGLLFFWTAQRRCFTLGVAMLLALGLSGWSTAAEAQAVGQRKILVCGKRTAIVAFSSEHPEGVVKWT